ncbi:MAG: hypothetical protein QM666_02065 [Acinetobacter sp.]
MKKLILASVTATLLLSACATEGTSGISTTANSTAQQLGSTAIKLAINAKCTTELNNYPAWQTVSKVLSSDQKQTLQDNVCGCVSEKAPESITAVDLAAAAMNPSQRSTIASKAIGNTVNQCVSEVFKQ